MQKLEPIPTPPSLRWREFRMQVMPVVVFACTIGAIIYLWNSTVSAPTLIGEVEAALTPVVTPDSGILTNLYVRRFQRVAKGEVLAEVVSTDSRFMGSQSQDLRGRIALSQLQVNSALDQQRLAFDYQNLSMNTMRFRADLAAAAAELPIVEAALARDEKAFKDQVLSVNDYQMSLRTRDGMKARVFELEKLVTESEARLREASHVAGAFTGPSSRDALPAALAVLEQDRKELEHARKAPLVLRSPVDGIVSFIHRRPGENLLAGEPVLTITPTESDRIIGYLRQPLPFQPKEGMEVQVRTRSAHREQSMARIVEVGRFYEPITNTALLRPGLQFEMGLPIAVTIPAQLKASLLARELVDLIVVEP